MNNKEPAFPIVYALGDFDRGMTLRDYFAAAALTGIYAHPDNVFNTHLMNATEAYEMADSMMRVREQS